MTEKDFDDFTVELHDVNDNVNDAAMKANSLMRPMMKHLVLNVDEVDGEAKKVLSEYPLKDS